MLLQDILKNYRKQNGLIQEQVAKKIFVTTQAVSKWENGQSIPSIDEYGTKSTHLQIFLQILVQSRILIRSITKIHKENSNLSTFCPILRVEILQHYMRYHWMS
jgi:Predicted transcription factor, homolog of eukaryotic MBF1